MPFYPCRPATLRSAEKSETGGLSGKPLLEPSTAVLARMYQLTGGKVPIIGVGGVSCGEDAYRKVTHGASLVQLYSALAYEGPGLVPRIKTELADCLRRDGFSNVSQAVGSALNK
jgi:dihydroorotate dehydrogenase